MKFPLFLLLLGLAACGGQAQEQTPEPVADSASQYAAASSEPEKESVEEELEQRRRDQREYILKKHPAYTEEAQKLIALLKAKEKENEQVAKLHKQNDYMLIPELREFNISMNHLREEAVQIFGEGFDNKVGMPSCQMAVVAADSYFQAYRNADRKPTDKSYAMIKTTAKRHYLENLQHCQDEIKEPVLP